MTCMRAVYKLNELLKKNLKTKLGSLLDKNHHQVELKEREQVKEIQKLEKMFKVWIQK